VIVDPAELLAGFDHPGGAPAQRYLPSRQCLTLREWFRQISIMLLTQLVLRRVWARVGGTPRRNTVRVSSRPSRSEAAAPGWCARVAAPGWVRSSSPARVSYWAWTPSAVSAW
jgi:hypothetical protein